MRNYIVILLVLFTGAPNIMAIEEPKYKVLKEYDEFELRLYSAYLIAETEIEANMEDAGSEAFQILFDYISGNNRSKSEIKMTAPVNVSNGDTEGVKIDMTAPVAQSTRMNSEGKFKVSFVVPSKYNIDTVPEPLDPRVTIREIPSRIVAVRKYSGTWSEENYRENEEILLDEISKTGYEIAGDPLYARYNPPFWPWFLRRNEVQVEILQTETALN